MPLFIKIIDDTTGTQDPVGSLADVLIDALRAKGVGIMRTENHVCEDLRTVIHDLIRDHAVVVNQPAVLALCSNCSKHISVWHTYADGTQLCTPCKNETVDVEQAGN